MSVLGVIDPPECDERGVPLDWEKCRMCLGHGNVIAKETGGEYPCLHCGGHGSLKAAALAYAVARSTALGLVKARCENCGHPMREGTWVVPEWSTNPHGRGLEAVALRRLRDGREPEMLHQHYSPCDEGCRHGGPGRWWDNDFGDWHAADAPPKARGYFRQQEASWRSVDVRTLGWPHDLRPEKLAVLCLRCYAARPPDDPSHGPDSCA